MKFEFFLLFLILKLVTCKNDVESENDLKIEAENGKSLVINSLQALFFGEPAEKAYKDLFLDTSKGIFEQTNGANDMVTVDDILRIFLQSVIILSSSRRPDLIPRDFHLRNKPYGKFVNELNSVLEKLKEVGTEKTTYKDLRLLINTALTDEFWASISQLKKEVDHEIELEKESEKNSKKQEL